MRPTLRAVVSGLAVAVFVAAALLVAAACSRSDDDLPPPIPLPQPQSESPAVRPPAHKPQAEQDPPKPWVPVPVPTASATASAAPSASADPDGVPSVTPYASPFPIVPKLPQIPGLPSIPGLPTSSPVEPDGKAHVVIYGTRTCPACAKLKNDLIGRKIPYDFVDLENPLELNAPLGQGSAEMPASMRNGIPVTRIQQRSGKLVWVQGAEAARVEKAYRG
jgi:glutaredoxin